METQHEMQSRGAGGSWRQSNGKFSLGAGDERAGPCATRGRGEEPLYHPRRQMRHWQEGPSEGLPRIAAEEDAMFRRVQASQSEQALCDLVGDASHDPPRARILIAVRAVYSTEADSAKGAGGSPS